VGIIHDDRGRGERGRQHQQQRVPTG
jgi:hypothetical protein